MRDEDTPLLPPDPIQHAVPKTQQQLFYRSLYSIPQYRPGIFNIITKLITSKM